VTTDTLNSLELLGSVNRCQVEQMEKAAERQDPCEEFFNHVRNVQASIINTYQVTAFVSLRERDPMVAASAWKRMRELCENALRVIGLFRMAYPNCGTPALYDLTLDYRAEAEKRYLQNLQDSECAKTPPPAGLFPNLS
jgi:hypothetical protein